MIRIELFTEMRSRRTVGRKARAKGALSKDSLALTNRNFAAVWKLQSSSDKTMEPLPPVKMIPFVALHKPPNVITGVAPRTGVLSVHAQIEQYEPVRKHALTA
jgi:hypothetical protein